MRLAIVSLLALAAAVPLGACTTLKQDVKGVTLAPMDKTSMLPQQLQKLPSSYGAPGTQSASSPNSLWRNGARTFFHDQRASQVGDILTVNVSINDEAQITNDTAHERKTNNNLGLTNLFGLEKPLSRIMTPANALTTNGDSASTATGTINRQDQIDMTIAAVVTKVLPNGNLVIQGKQEVKTNNEVRELTVAGVVRPEDISAANTINHTQIAEARISYAGRGDLSRAQKSPWGQSIMEDFSPF